MDDCSSDEYRSAFGGSAKLLGAGKSVLDPRLGSDFFDCLGLADDPSISGSYATWHE
ncbi:hypothetical protein D3C80_2119990 [compost metagenome]